MKLKKSKYCFVLGCLLFCFISFIHSQCDIKFYKNQNDDLIFHSSKFTDSLQFDVHVCLTYQYDDFYGRWKRTGIDIKNIKLRTKSNNQQLKIFDYSDTAYQCIRDTLIKYIHLYYKDPNRLLTAFELHALEPEGPLSDSIKVELPFPSIYIYPLQKTTKNQKKRLKYSNGS